MTDNTEKVKEMSRLFFIEKYGREPSETDLIALVSIIRLTGNDSAARYLSELAVICCEAATGIKGLEFVDNKVKTDPNYAFELLTATLNLMQEDKKGLQNAVNATLQHFEGMTREEIIKESECATNINLNKVELSVEGRERLSSAERHQQEVENAIQRAATKFDQEYGQ